MEHFEDVLGPRDALCPHHWKTKGQKQTTGNVCPGLGCNTFMLNSFDWEKQCSDDNVFFSILIKGGLSWLWVAGSPHFDVCAFNISNLTMLLSQAKSFSVYFWRWFLLANYFKNVSVWGCVIRITQRHNGGYYKPLKIRNRQNWLAWGSLLLFYFY